MSSNPKALLTRFASSKLFWPLVIWALLLLYNLAFTKGFMSIEIREGNLFGSLIDILKNSTQIGIIAIGLTLVIATKGIDVSVGTVVAIGGAMAAYLIGGRLVIVNGVQHYVSNVPMVLAIAGALGITAVCGMWNGMLVTRIKMQPIVATLILMVAGRGVAQLITSGQIITIYYAPYFFIGNGHLFGLPFPVYIMVFMLILTVIVTRRTALGLYIESIGINPTASRYAGIKPETYVFWTYAFVSICAGISGLIVSSNVHSADGNNAGRLFELDAILAVVIGGTSLNGGKFYLGGSVVGALIIQTLTTTIYTTGVAPQAAEVVKAVVVFLVSILQSKSFRDLVFRTVTGRRRVAVQ